MKIALAGGGAFGEKHLDGLKNIDGVEVTALVGRQQEPTQAMADKYGIGFATTDYEAMLERDDVDAVILCTPTQMHADQAIKAMDAGKHVEVEIPLADSLADAEAVLAKSQETGLVCMAGHTRRFNPSHQWVKQQIDAGNLNILAMDVETYFFRRENKNAKGEPRSWTDHLLWHHSAHTIDIFQYMTGAKVVKANILQGPKHPQLGIAMDQSIQMKTDKGQILTLSLSFNNEGPFGTFFRYIGDTGTYLARYDDLFNGKDEPIDLSGMDVPSTNGIELQDREFIAAIREGREPNSSVADTIECYRTIGALAASLEDQDGWS
ncbi:Gfo/Idh/MocA family oxidoreductase [Aurantiacibacter luteus]|uniref:Oxidoreductase n=1 Tax=Aurantiacibacter luteus TaxID=1581420 RepID=A0A0G9MXU9_9SPHN|nr:Gfo/Idh/MocA family oxidoreductase [Aurantiacibacter luteus]KLE34098.1 oxidoreductase [Aurantiacibacter luteus]